MPSRILQSFCDSSSEYTRQQQKRIEQNILLRINTLVIYFGDDCCCCERSRYPMDGFLSFCTAESAARQEPGTRHDALLMMVYKEE